MVIRRKCSLTTIAFWLLLLALGYARAGTNLISDLYYTSMVSPAETDRFIHRNKQLLDNRFLSCLYQWRQSAGIQGANTGEFCRSLPDDQATACRSNNYALSVYLWTVSIEEAVKGKAWRETFIGGQAYQAKELTDALGTGAIVARVNRSISQMLTCP